MSWRTGELVVTQGGGRNVDLFVRHLDDLRRAFRRYRVVHVICDTGHAVSPANGSRRAENALFLRLW